MRNSDMEPSQLSGVTDKTESFTAAEVTENAKYRGFSEPCDLERPDDVQQGTRSDRCGYQGLVAASAGVCMYKYVYF